jgi:hypothetical protein
MAYHPRSLNCGDCRQPFPFSIEQQTLSAELGYDEPGRCPACRRSLEISRRPVPVAAFLA